MVKHLLSLLLAVVCAAGYAQSYFQQPAPDEKVLEIIIDETSGWNYGQVWYSKMLKTAQEKYPDLIVDIKGMTCSRATETSSGVQYFGPVTAKIVVKINPQEIWKERLSQNMEKAFRNLQEGSRMAIDRITVAEGIKIDKDDIKDQVIDVLLERGYRVVAKEYLERLYKEQLQQQNAIYNDQTKVHEGNFSAVGFFVNVKISQHTLRVQVINVSTGEYEGNVTINF